MWKPCEFASESHFCQVPATPPFSGVTLGNKGRLKRKGTIRSVQKQTISRIIESSSFELIETFRIFCDSENEPQVGQYVHSFGTKAGCGPKSMLEIVNLEPGPPQ
jgi:hypothetical protein